MMVMDFQSDHEELSAISTILDLFQNVSISNDNSPTITIKQMTDYLIDKVMNVGEKFQFVSNKYNSKLMEKYNNEVYKSSTIEEFLPEVHGECDKCLRRIFQENNAKDKDYHPYLIRDI